MLQLHQPQHLVHPRIRRVGGHAPHLQSEADVARDRQVRKQCVALEHNPDVAAVGRYADQALVVQQDVTPGGRDETGDHA